MKIIVKEKRSLKHNLNCSLPENPGKRIWELDSPKSDEKRDNFSCNLYLEKKKKKNFYPHSERGNLLCSPKRPLLLQIL